MISTICSQMVKKLKNDKHMCGGGAERESTTKPIGKNTN